MLRSKKMRMALAVLMCAALSLGTAAQAFADVTSTWFNYEYDSPGSSPLATWPSDPHVHWSNQPWVLNKLTAWNTVYDVAADNSTDVKLSNPTVKINGGAANVFWGPITISAEGTHSVALGAVDSSGTAFSEQLHVQGIDYGRPVASSNVKPVYDVSALISVSATDTRSGAQYIVYSLDNASDWTTSTIDYSGPKEKFIGTIDVAAGVGAHTLAYYAIDFAGNTSLRETVKFNVLASGYKPVLSNPTAKQSLKRKITFRGKVTAAATDKRVKLVVQKWSSKSKTWKTYSTIYAPAKMYMDSYAKAAYFKPGLYRVRASQGTGKSPKLVTFRVK